MVVAIVIGFGSSEALAFAYGVAVTGTFILNTILFLAVARLLWRKPKRLIALGAAVFLTVEVAFFAANLTKIVHGGWLPIAVATRVHRPHDLAQGARDRDRQPQQGGGTAAGVRRAAGGRDSPVQHVPGVACSSAPTSRRRRSRCAPTSSTTTSSTTRWSSSRSRSSACPTSPTSIGSS